MTVNPPAGASARTTQCCIAGGGPAGIMLGFLLARAGVDVIVLEKHANFFRDFRGDTIHPSTLQVMDELGLLDKLLRIPHSEIRKLSGFVGDKELRFVDLSHVPGRCKFIAFMPQWDLLNFMAGEGRAYPGFHLEMNTEATDIVVENDSVTGVRARQNGQEITIRANLIVAADGRRSTLRRSGAFDVIETGAPIDVLWLRLSRKESDPQQSFGNVAQGGLFVMINRIDYYQCAFVIRKNAFDEIKSRGIGFLQQEIVRIVPWLKDRILEIASFDDVRLLTVAVDHLKTWYRPGMLCIGDAAHAMSPIGGVGINLAIQDAVAGANILWRPLLEGRVTTADLKAVQDRRESPTRKTQALQVFLQERIINPVLTAQRPIKAPLLLQLLAKIPYFRRIPARIVGVGFRPEHVHSPKV